MYLMKEIEYSQWSCHTHFIQINTETNTCGWLTQHYLSGKIHNMSIRSMEAICWYVKTDSVSSSTAVPYTLVPYC